MTRLIAVLVGVLWALAGLRILFPVPELSWLASAVLVVFVVLAVPRSGRHTQILCAVLALATIVLAEIYGRWDAVPEGLSRATIFPAFLSTIILLRATAEQRPEIISARHLFGSLEQARRDNGLVIGTHFLGAILQVGVFAILAPILKRDTPDEERRHIFLVAMRGMSLVPLWSPFVVGMALASQYLPEVRLWQIMSLGLSLAATGILISFLFFDRSRDLEGLRLALRSLAPVGPPICVAALVIITTTAVTGLSTLEALIISMPIPCLGAIMMTRAGSLSRAIHQTAQGLPRIGPESSILAFAMTLGMVFEATLPQTGLLDWLLRQAFPPAVIIFVVIMSLNITGLFGLHPVVTGTVLLVVFTSVPTGLTDLVLMQSLLTGWGLCTAISISSLSVATGSVMFRLAPTQLITLTNGVFVFLTSTVAGIILTILNGILLGI